MNFKTNIMQEQLISFKTARLAYKNNFDLFVANCYNENGELGDESDGGLLIDYNGFTKTEVSNTNLYSAPSQSLLQRWLREIYKLHITIFSSSQESWMFRITKPHQKLEEGIYGEDYDSFEEALEDGLQDALELINN